MMAAETILFFLSFPQGEHDPAKSVSLLFVRTAIGKKFPNSTYPLSNDLLFSLHMDRAVILGPAHA